MLRRLVTIVLCACALTSCRADGPTAPPPKAAVPALDEMPKYFSLTLIGYNYTNRYIDTYEVNGQGGGNLYVSGPTTGGSGSVCCVGYSTSTKLPQEVTVRWQSGGCRVLKKTSSGFEYFDIRHAFKEKKVFLNRPIPEKPENFEVHIYPDDKVEVAITEDHSPPRLKLPKSREDNSDYPRCKDGE